MIMILNGRPISERQFWKRRRRKTKMVWKKNKNLKGKRYFGRRWRRSSW